MRRLYWLATVAIIFSLSSCSNDKELDNSKTNNNREIGFRSFIDKGVASRATVTTGENILGFTVTGWWDRTDKIQEEGETESDSKKAFAAALARATTDEYLFNAYDITRREAGFNKWTYSPVRYWPAKDVIGGGVTFFAYSPASSKNVVEETSGVYTGGLRNYTGEPIIYTVPDPGREEAQEDFLLARTEVMTKDDVNSNGAVELTFAHALSRVRFFARTTNTNLTYVIGGVEMLGLNKKGEIKLSDIPTNGTFTYSDTDPKSTPVVLWTPLSTTLGKIGIDMGESPINLLGAGAITSGYHSLQGETNALMVLPQTTTLGNLTNPEGSDPDNPTYEGFLIKVLYKAYLNNPNGTYFAGSKDKYQAIYSG